MTKLIIQIPCLNEAATLPEVIAGIPTEIEGVDVIETLIVDDGSTDGTSEVAKSLGINHIVQHSTNRGLAKSFAAGIEQCLKSDADIIVNMDGDNQYPGDQIPALIAPLLSNSADVCVGNRQTDKIKHFSAKKKLLQRIGSKVVRYLSGVDVPDAVSGFRAIKRDAALHLSILTEFSYTIEMLIQAGNLNLRVTHVPITTNAKTRESRLFKSNIHFISKAISTMLRSYMMYKPIATFCSIGSLFFLMGAIPISRFLYFFFTSGGEGHVQSLVLGSMLVILGVMCILLAMVADMIAKNRMLLHELILRSRRRELELHLDSNIKNKIQ